MMSTNSSLGTLTLTLTNCIVEGTSQRLVPETTANLSEGVVHERSKKMGAHCVQLGKTMKRQSTRTAVHYHKVGDPIVKFIWRYRPLGMKALLEPYFIYLLTMIPH
jgi:hypothetical protein